MTTMTTGMTMTTKKRRNGIRYPATRLAITAGSVVAFLVIWVQVARTAGPIATVPALQFATGSAHVEAPAAGRGEPEPAPAMPVPTRSVSRGS
jgi:hypothetical protein